MEPIKCIMYSVEWQKNGPPHAHILLWIQTEFQLFDAGNVISTEFPNPNEESLLHEIILMVCGSYEYINAQISRKCTKKYPRQLHWKMRQNCFKLNAYISASEAVWRTVSYMRTIPTPSTSRHSLREQVENLLHQGKLSLTCSCST